MGHAPQVELCGSSQGLLDLLGVLPQAAPSVVVYAVCSSASPVCPCSRIAPVPLEVCTAAWLRPLFVHRTTMLLPTGAKHVLPVTRAEIIRYHEPGFPRHHASSVNYSPVRPRCRNRFPSVRKCGIGYRASEKYRGFMGHATERPSSYCRSGTCPDCLGGSNTPNPFMWKGFGRCTHQDANLKSTDQELNSFSALYLGFTVQAVILAPFDNETGALRKDFSGPENIYLLNGLWQLQWPKGPDSRSVEFHKSDFNASSWNTTPVPADWKMQGGYQSAYVVWPC